MGDGFNLNTSNSDSTFFYIPIIKLMLQGIKVMEFEGLAPSVFLGMVLSDYGAEVTVISRIDIDTPPNPMNRGK